MVDLNKLTELRNQIRDCEQEISTLEAYLKGDVQNKSTARSSKADELKNTIIEDQIDETVVDPIEATYHCLNIAICLLKDKSIKQLTPQLRSLFDTLVIPNIGSVNEEIRIFAVKAMNLICILKVEIAQKYVPLLLEMIQNDMKEIVIDGKIIFF